MSRKALLFLHGIAGSPRIFDFLQESIPPELDAFFLVLKGHLPDEGKFGRQSYPIWKEQVRKEVERLLSSYDSLVLVGHSMGCLLAMDMALLFPERIEFLFLLCPPLRIHVRLFPMLKNIKCALFGTGKSEDESVLEARRCAGLLLSHNPFSYLPWARPFLSLLWNIPKVRERIRDLKTPFHAYHCGKDELVSLKAKKDLLLPQGKNSVLENSSHYLFVDGERERVLSDFKDVVALSIGKDQKQQGSRK